MSADRKTESESFGNRKKKKRKKKNQRAE